MINNHWQKNVYKKNLQLNKIPFDEVISYFKKINSNKKKIYVLEIGCGCGNNLSFLAEEGYNVSGIDFSSKAIDIAKKNINSKKLKVDLKVGNIKKLDWPDKKFDFVFDRSAITHNTYEDINLILKEVRRVLKKNGTLISFDLFGLNTPDIKYGKKISNYTYTNFKKGYFKKLGMTSFFNFIELKKLFKNFKIMKIEKKQTTNQNNQILNEFFNIEVKKK